MAHARRVELITVYRSSIRDTFLEYLEVLREDQATAFRHSQALYVGGGLKEAPSVPDLLRGDEP